MLKASVSEMKSSLVRVALKPEATDVTITVESEPLWEAGSDGKKWTSSLDSNCEAFVGKPVPSKAEHSVGANILLELTSG